MIALLATLALALPAPQEPALRPGDVALVEAERPTRRDPQGDTFARPHGERWASGRTCLVAFSGEGRCTWTFELEDGGPHRIWIRYAAATPVTLRVGVDPTGAELDDRDVPATGGYEGKHAWSWALVFEGDLAAGAHQLVLAAAPLRPDCFLVTTEEAAPELLRPAPPPTYDEATLARIARPLVPLGARGGRSEPVLPEWYEHERVHVHTRLARPWVDEPLFVEAEEKLAGLGARVIVRHVKLLAGGALWPSEVGAVEPQAKERDLVAEMVERAHALGLRLIAYYRHVEDAPAAAQHPEWVCLDDLGRPILRDGQPRLCFNTPYLDFVRTRLVELAQRGVDGIYLDEDHVTLEGCWCQGCQEAFRRETGLPHPASPDEEDPLYRKLREFMDLTAERTVARLRLALQLARPDLLLIVSTHLQPDLVEPHPSLRLLRVVDAAKTELGIGAGARSRAFFARHPELAQPPRDAALALGWALTRDGTGGRPPHVWIHGLRDERAARAATAAVIAYGGVANLDHPEETIPDAATLGPALELGARLSPVYAGTRPVRLLALHVPERARAALEPDEVAVWRELMAPVVSAWTRLLRAHVPVGLVTDDQLVTAGWLEGYAALLLPAADTLEPSQARQVEAFRARGGLVIEPGPDGSWEDLGAFPSLDRLPVRIEAPERVHATCFRGHDPERLVVGLVNGLAWVSSEPPAEGVRVELRLDDPPESVIDAVSGERLEVQREGGRAFVEVPSFDVACVLLIE